MKWNLRQFKFWLTFVGVLSRSSFLRALTLTISSAWAFRPSFLGLKLHLWMTMQSSLVFVLLMLNLAFFNGLGRVSSRIRGGFLILLLDRGVLIMESWPLFDSFSSFSESFRDLDDSRDGVEIPFTHLFPSASAIDFAAKSAFCFISDSFTEMKLFEFFGPSPNRQKNTQFFFCLPMQEKGTSSVLQIKTLHFPKKVSMLKSPLYLWPSCTSSQFSSRGGFTVFFLKVFGNCSIREYHWTWALKGSFLFDSIQSI